MHSDGRKHMRIALGEKDYANFCKAKDRAERTMGVLMTDPQYAVSLIRWAVRSQDQDD